MNRDNRILPYEYQYVKHLRKTSLLALQPVNGRPFFSITIRAMTDSEDMPVGTFDQHLPHIPFLGARFGKNFGPIILDEFVILIDVVHNQAQPSGRISLILFAKKQFNLISVNTAKCCRTIPFPLVFKFQSLGKHPWNRGSERAVYLTPVRLGPSRRQHLFWKCFLYNLPFFQRRIIRVAFFIKRNYLLHLLILKINARFIITSITCFVFTAFDFRPVKWFPLTFTIVMWTVASTYQTQTFYRG